ncbi:SIS domain-containing protein [Deinococcus radiotolerans]|uniref:Phosphosugar isomerase n=1 Tax=Deinococcus radiotolerans TaxID=1309407 RepID=A0ABQ2FJ33_9DEIO|nr:SIS domain-containing protein [Deinococcus radiotolerans]GGK94353.1 phosphosugar isomerase [Deinococcus radiotolerans]
MSTHLLTLLETLPGSYSGPTRPEDAPYGLAGSGEGTLAAHLAQTLVASSLTRSGTQFVLSSPDAAALATDYADLASVAGAQVRRVATGGTPEEIDTLVPGGPLATYHFAQYVAHATGHSEDAQAADALIADLAARCAPHIEENNPARDLAWSLWGRTPLLLAAPDADALPHAWQQLLARTGKTLSVPLIGDPLPVVTGAFEAQHEKGDAKVAVILGDADDTLLLAREVLESRIDEIIHVPYPDGAVGYPAQLALWYFGAWVAAYLAERYGASAADQPVLGRAQGVMSGEDREQARLAAPRDDLRRTNVVKDWADDHDVDDVDLDDDDLGDEDGDDRGEP